MLTLGSADIAHWLGAFVWPFLRILALFSVAPGFGSAAIPARVKVAIAFIIAWIVAALIKQTVPLTLSWTALAVAGDFIGLQMGFGFAGLLDVQNRFEVPIIADLFGLIGLLLFLTLNGHLILLGFLVKSFEV